ncbi:HIF1AN [Cordylochernes scorpioides]|uniref:HIF1AN n=1 Tax=Cordylochernes scorpioides TaxID=51811 RepID=A0ABY6LEV4_9ARAC|nr:HIF1AN [Cordylochernes scorpioides]
MPKMAKAIDIAKPNYKFRDYGINLEPILTLEFNDPKVVYTIGNEQPVIIKNSGAVDPLLKWDLSYLEKHMGSQTQAVYSSSSHNFKFYDEHKPQQFGLSNIPFQPPHSCKQMTIKEFAKAFKGWKPGDDRLYLQNSLYSEGVNAKMLKDFQSINWGWFVQQKCLHGWGPLTSNLLLVSHPGCLTPAHYDEQNNIFAQLHGYKRFLLFPPMMMKCLYPYPIYHPHDRQSQVDFDSPDLSKFPRFNELKGYEAILGPGDLLYLPNYWWHHVETSSEGWDQCVSVNFWYKASPAKNIEFPLKGSQKMALSRNLEKLFIETLKNVDEIEEMWQAMVLGRYLQLGEEKKEEQLEDKTA